MALTIKADDQTLPAIASFFGLQPPADNYAMAPDASGEPAPLPTSPGKDAAAQPAPGDTGKTKLDALSELLNPQAKALVDAAQGDSSGLVPPTQPIASQPVSSLPSVPQGAPVAKPTFATEHPALANFLSGLTEFVQDAGPGVGSRTFGEGFSTAAAQPGLRAQRQTAIQKSALENFLTGQKIADIPLDRAAKIAGIKKTQADTAKTEAETNDPIKDALQKAQTEAAYYKSDPNLGLIDIRTGKPVAGGTTVPLSAEEAAVLGKNEGDQVPIKLKNTANEIVSRGIVSTSVGGRQILVNKATGKKIADLGAATPVVINQLNNPFQNIPINGTGDDALKGLNAKQQALIKGIANYDINPNTVSTRNNQRQDVISAVKLYNPTYDETQFPAKQAIRKDFTSGKSAANIRSLNTAIGHLEQLQEAGTALNNGSFPLINKVANEIGVQVGSSPRVTFDAVKNAVVGEVASVYKNSGATDQEISAIRGTFDNAMSPQQLQGAIQQTVKLFGSRLNALDSQYKQGIGKPADFQILNPESQRILKTLAPGVIQQNTAPTKQDQDLQKKYPGFVPG